MELTHIFGQSKEKLMRVVMQCRRQQKAGDFIRLNRNSIRLFGKQVFVILSCIDKKKLHEIIPLEDEMSVERYSGESVTLSDVFLSSENAVWDGDTIMFKTEDDVLVSANQYEYIQKHGPLSQYHYFAKSNNKDFEMMRVWKDLSRKSAEARKDKAKEILYLTIGTVTWTITEATATKPAVRVTSPIMQCQIMEASNSKDRPRFTIIADTVKVNSILARELKQRNVELFLNVTMDNIPFGQSALDALKAIEDNAKYCPDIEVNINDFNICLLDSTNETICQLIEKHIDELAASPLIQVLMGERMYEELPVRKVADYPIYPLPTDDSQRDVINDVLAGHSINISAAAGTGKSHLMVLLAACLVIAGRNLCVMSEKRAANEVFLKYAAKIGLDQFCLEINNKMTVPQIIDQLDRICNTAQVYVDPVRARDLLSETAEIEKSLEDYNEAVYSAIPGLDLSLYELIGEAISRDVCTDVSACNISLDKYRAVCRKLETLQEDINNTVSDEDFESFLREGTTGDNETDELLSESVNSLKHNGVDIIAFVKSNCIAYDEICAVAKANLARILASKLVHDKKIEKYGNVFLRSKYAKLTEAYAKLQSLYRDYMRQQLSARIAKASAEDTELIPILERIKTSKMSVNDFFKKYGAAILKLCPVIVTTPSAAINYVTDEMNIFDALLIDEASQVPIASVIPFLIKERQLIAFGDNNQLDIMSFFMSDDEDGYDENGEFDLSRTDKSILHLVQGKGIPSRRLSYHYRSKTQHLFVASNLLCYNGNINLTPDVFASWSKLPAYLGFEIVKVDVPFDTAKALAAVLSKSQTTKRKENNTYITSYMERVKSEMAKGIAERVAQIKDNTPEKSVGVVTLNDIFQNMVIDELEDLIADGSLDCDIDNDEDVWVRSLENAQGKEADVIIIAIDHARRNVNGVLLKNISGYFHGGEKGEQSGNNRLNVLFTRAREKNIIYLSFDYNEIKDSDRSLKRLYTYLEYAATGNMSCIAEKPIVEDKTNNYAAQVISVALNGCEVKSKVGANAMMVDLGVLDTPDADKFKLGFLLPNHKITPNTLYTKINLLERAGWRVLPLSLVYLLEKPETYKSQLPKMIDNEHRLGSDVEENYLTATKPAVPVTLEEIALREQMNEPDINEGAERAEVITPLTVPEFAQMDIETACRQSCDDTIKAATQQVIDLSYKQNTQAFLVKLAQSAHKAAINGDSGKLSGFTNKAYYLYKNMGEKRACYLLAQLLRLTDSEGNQQFIKDLLEESVAMNIIEEVA